MNYTEMYIFDLGRIVTGKTPSTKNPSFFNGAYQFVTPSDLSFKHYYCRETETTVTEEAFEKHKNQFIPIGSVMFTCIGNTIGKCAISSSLCLTNQQINSIIPNPEFDTRFIYYLMIYNADKVRGIGLGGGSATPIINKTDFSRIKVKVPPKHVRDVIVNILSAYDDLIENNQRRVNLLEQTMRRLYKEWFVHLRFSGHKHVKIIDGVPKGWKYVCMPDIIEINPAERVEKGTPIRYVPMSSLSETGMSINISEVEIRDKATNVKFRNDDILLARITPCLENGKTAFVNFLRPGEVACGSTEFIVLRGQRVSPYFVYCLARTHDFRENAIKSMIGSSGRQRVQVSCFNEFKVYLPPVPLLEQFNEFASNCFSQIANLQKQIEQLTKARDLLLPRLMNGEIAV